MFGLKGMLIDLPSNMNEDLWFSGSCYRHSIDSFSNNSDDLGILGAQRIDDDLCK